MKWKQIGILLILFGVIIGIYGLLRLDDLSCLFCGIALMLIGIGLECILKQTNVK